MTPLWKSHIFKITCTLGGLIKGQASGKLIGCEGNFAQLVWPPGGKVFIERISVQIVSPACETSSPPAENVNKTPTACKAAEKASSDS